MNRRNFIGYSIAGGVLSALPTTLISCRNASQIKGAKELSADIVIIGGGMGGCATALGALRNGLKVIMTEETDWIGGQITQQGVPPDENPWIETHGSTQSYRDFRTAIRDYYKRVYPMTDEARARIQLNPGDGSVSRICHEPRVTLAVLTDMFNPFISSGRLTLLLEYKAVAADVVGNKVSAIKVSGRLNDIILNAPYFVDATEMGDLLPLTGTEFVTGTESKKDTGELHASDTSDPQNQQAFTMCFAMDYEKGADHTIDKPSEYDFWRSHVPDFKPAWSGRLLDLTYCNPSTLEPKKLGFHPEGIDTGDALNLWNYRRIINKNNFLPGTFVGDISMVNWPQNDYALGTLDTDFHTHVARAKQLSLSLLYWLQTECPRPDDGQGWPGLRLRGDLMGTEDGLAKYPYVREARRIKASFTILEEHVGKEQRLAVSGDDHAAPFADSIGIGYYRIDLHPSTKGNNYIDFESLRYQIPLGALIPQRMENLLPVCKNIGTTHITNGCFRLHPVEWNIGESVGTLVGFALQHKVSPRTIRETSALMEDFQNAIRSQGVETEWRPDS
ncbi:MAG: FAD-dependent oxidoreductase [Tannerella sp.]|jgi:hypothetical protein|nr:FAD-dependent oxidoreductase [Tannerella sp.]